MPRKGLPQGRLTGYERLMSSGTTLVHARFSGQRMTYLFAEKRETSLNGVANPSGCTHVENVRVALELYGPSRADRLLMAPCVCLTTLLFCSPRRYSLASLSAAPSLSINTTVCLPVGLSSIVPRALPPFPHRDMSVFDVLLPVAAPTYCICLDILCLLRDFL